MPSFINRKKFLQLTAFAPLSLAAKPFHSLVNSMEKNGSEPAVIYYKADTPGYDQLRKGFNKRIEKKPAIIALCKNTSGVAEAIKYAIANQLPVAIKSGGHCMEGFSCNDGGMVINMSAMKLIEWLDKETIKLNPGCKLAQIYDELLPKGKIIPGGSCAGVGIGGLTLGGGYGLMARKFGLTCDSLQSLTMVDGTATVITASGNDELMWACRGGNNGNFGVVTEMTFKVHPAPATMQSFRFRAYQVNTQRAKSILKEWFALTASLPVECFSAFVLNGKTLYILLTNIGKQTKESASFIRQMKLLTDKTTNTIPQPLAKALKVYYGKTEPLYFKNASAGLYKQFEDVENFIDKAIDTVRSTPGMIYQVNTLGGNIQNPAFEKGSSFPHRGYPYFSELQAYWDSPVQEKKLLERFQQVQDVFNNNGIAAQYRNYPDINFTNWQNLYYGNNYQRLQQVKAAYDPNNIFRYQQSIQIP